MQRKFIIGSRGSKLALIYAQNAKNKIIQNTNLNEDDVVIKEITTKGDQVQDIRLSEVGGKGLFSTNIEKELQDKKIDIAVHALKDMPAIETDGLRTNTFLKRNDPREILITKNKKKLNLKLNIESLGVQLENQFSYNEKFTLGLSEFNYSNLKSIAEYKTNKNYFEFKLFDKAQKSKFSYNGKLNFKPFYSYLEGSTTELNFDHLFSTNAIIKQLLKTEIFNNKNIDFKLNISANKIKNIDNFTNIFLKSKIQEGLIDLDQTKFSWKNHVNFNLTDSLIYIKDGKLILDANSEINITNLDEVYKFLLTPKSLRKKINKMNINFTYLFDEKIININNIRVNDKIDQNLNNNINKIYLKDNILQNKFYFKKFLNEAIKSYAG